LRIVEWQEVVSAQEERFPWKQARFLQMEGWQLHASASAIDKLGIPRKPSTYMRSNLLCTVLCCLLDWRPLELPLGRWK
jgi:hypothetical protein